MTELLNYGRHAVRSALGIIILLTGQTLSVTGTEMIVRPGEYRPDLGVVILGLGMSFITFSLFINLIVVKSIGSTLDDHNEKVIG